MAKLFWSFPWLELLFIVFCVITMLCWGSWANTQKLAQKGWRFELFYWDYTIGVLLLTLILGLTLGSHGTDGRAFVPDLEQASSDSIISALIGGAIFNVANILLVAAIDIAGMSVAFPALNVKLVGTHAGISIGEDGPSQMGIEDVALARSFPGMTVIIPCDAPSAKKATAAMIDHVGPTYLRLGRPKVPVVYTNGCNFEIGKAITLRDGSDVTIIANGLMVPMALDAAHDLAGEGISARVIDMHNAKPVDEEQLLSLLGVWLYR